MWSIFAATKPRKQNIHDNGSEISWSFDTFDVDAFDGLTSCNLFSRAILLGSSSFKSTNSPFLAFSTTFPGTGRRAEDNISGSDLAAPATVDVIRGQIVDTTVRGTVSDTVGVEGGPAGLHEIDTGIGRVVLLENSGMELSKVGGGIDRPAGPNPAS